MSIIRQTYRYTLHDLIAACVATAHNADYSAINLDLPFDLSELRRNENLSALEVDMDFSDEDTKEQRENHERAIWKAKQDAHREGFKKGQESELGEALAAAFKAGKIHGRKHALDQVLKALDANLRETA